MIDLLKIGEEPLRKIRDYAITSSKIDGGGGGTTESGDKILDYRSLDNAVITVTFENLTMAEYSALKKKLIAKTIELTYWDGEYKTITVTVGDIASKIRKSEQRPNTPQYNNWDLSTTFTQVRTEVKLENVSGE